MIRQLDILRHIVQPNLWTLILSVIAGGIIWFMPEIMGIYDMTAQVNVMFMKQFVMWSYPSWAARLSGFVATTAIFFWIMWLCERLQVLPVRSAMPLIVGLSIAGAINYSQAFDESYFVIALFILALQQLINMYHFDRQAIAGFNIILLLSCAALFEPQYVWLSLLFVLGMIIFRVVNGKIFLSILFGIITVTILSTSIFWMFDKFDVLTEYIKQFIDISLLTSDTVLRRSDLVFAIIIIILVLFTLITYITANRHYKLNVRLNFTFIGWSFWISLIWVVLFAGNFDQLIAVPGLFAILCMSLYFTSNHNNMANIMFLIYSGVVIAYRVIWCLGF